MGIKITPLAGAQHPTAALSYLLEIDDGQILLDCGCSDWPSKPEVESYLQTLAQLAPTLDLLVLSHPLLASLALVPYLRARLGLRCPIYATLPTKEMGRWAVEEWYAQRAAQESNGLAESGSSAYLLEARQPWNRRSIVDNQTLSDSTVQAAEDVTLTDRTHEVWKLSLKELRDAFDSIIAVRYSQPIHLGGKLRPLTLTAHRSGHTIGGTIWSLRSPLHTVSSSSSSTLLYAPIFNHLKERHLDSAALLSSGEGGMRIGTGMSRPMVMMIGTERSLSKTVRKKDRDQVLLDTITSTLQSGHSVLVPTDASARLIELLLMLDAHWTSARLETIPLCLVSHTGKDVVTFVRSLTEWMSPLAPDESQLRPRGRDRDRDGGPLRLRHLRFFDSLDALEREVPAGHPKLILAVPVSMAYGFARTLFARLVQTPGNLVVLTSMGEDGSLAAWLAEQANLKTDSAYGTGTVPEPVTLDTSISLELKERVVLEGEELEQYLEDTRRAKERRAKHEAMLTRSRRMIDEDDDSDRSSSSDEGSDSDSDKPMIAHPKRLSQSFAAPVAKPTWDEFVDETETLAFDIYVKGSWATKATGARNQRYRMFPFVERRRKVDAYGEMLDVDGWLRRGDTVERASNIKTENGTKRKWDEVAEEVIIPEKPSKFISHVEEVKVMCKVLLIDLEGKADGRALQTIIPHINPKTVVLINGTSSSHQDFTQAVMAVPSFTHEIFSPQIGEGSVIAHDTKSFSVRLGDGLMSSLRLSKIEGFEVGYVTGTLQVPDESSIPTLEKLSGNVQASRERRHQNTGIPPQVSLDGKVDLGHLIEPLPSSSSTIFIGEVRLAGLKAHLAQLGIPAEFAAEGVLVCGPVGGMRGTMIEYEIEGSLGGGTVAVRKSAKGQLVIEGPVGVTSNVIRMAVYGLHAAMSGN